VLSIPDSRLPTSGGLPPIPDGRQAS